MGYLRRIQSFCRIVRFFTIPHFHNYCYYLLFTIVFFYFQQLIFGLLMGPHLIFFSGQLPVGLPLPPPPPPLNFQVRRVLSESLALPTFVTVEMIIIKKELPLRWIIKIIKLGVYRLGYYNIGKEFIPCSEGNNRALLLFLGDDLVFLAKL